MEIETFVFDWKNAKRWQETENEKSKTDIKWSFDCGYKLDFDGGIVTVESRFYPPHKNNHNGWEGTMNFNVCGEKWTSFDLKEDTLEQIKNKAVKLVKRQSEIIKSRITNP